MAGSGSSQAGAGSSEAGVGSSEVGAGSFEARAGSLELHGSKALARASAGVWAEFLLELEPKIQYLQAPATHI